MLFSDIPFARLRTLLLNLGFIERVIDGQSLGFYHAESDTVFMFRLYGPQDRVSMMDLAGVRFQLDWRGLLSREAFDAALRKASA
ncbi:MAG TPA: hypothetical protein VJ739_03935 [Gemmataceae bacterium]|nr:hypothetical protein [Gemmataceae bacterium]